MATDMFILISCLVLGLLCPLSCQGAQISGSPASFSPRSYRIRLEPNVDNNTVKGTVIITFNTTKDQSNTLNYVPLNSGTDVTVEEISVKLLDFSGFQKTTAGVEYDDANTIIKVLLPEGDSLQHGHLYTVSLQFTSLLYSDPTGLFTGLYNSTSQYIASNFRPNFARNVFPCFDEPQFKAAVTLEVRRPQTFSSVSSAPLLSSVDLEDGTFLDTFKTTSPISIHSLGLFISEITPYQSPSGLTVYAPPDFPSSTPFLDDVLSKISSSVGPFPISPVNLVLLPDRVYTIHSSYGFVFSSPEVFGYGEPKSLSGSELLSLKLQVTEEFLRQFLEYAKTPASWSHIWLSDSTTAYMATDLIPEADPWVRVLVRSQALGEDYNYPSVPLVASNALSHWDVANIIANKTIKHKGLSLLKMWNDTMPVGVVNKTLIDFINLPKTSVTTSDLIGLLIANIESDRTYNVTPVINSLPIWLNTSGYPVVSYQPYNTTSFSLSQQGGCSAPNSVEWPVSVSYAQNTTQNWHSYRQGMWLLQGSQAFTPADYSPDRWITFNLETGPYRVAYSSWDDIIAALKDDPVMSGAPDSVRASLQDDAAALSLLGCLPFSTSLALLAATKRNHLDWVPLAKTFDALSRNIGDDQSVYNQLQLFAESLFSPETVSSLDLVNRSSDPDLQFVRTTMTPWLCAFDIGDCRQAVAELSGQLWLGDVSKIDPGDVENVACYGAYYSDSALPTILAAYADSTSTWLHKIYTIALGCLSDSNSVLSLLNSFMNSTSPVSTTDARKIMVSLAGKMKNSATVTDFVSERAYDIQSTFGVWCLSAVITNLGKFRTNITKLQVLVEDGSLDPYVTQSTVAALNKATAAQNWWLSNAGALSEALPHRLTTPGTTTTYTTPRPTTTTTESSSSSFSSSSLSSSTEFTSSTSPKTTAPTTTTSGPTTTTSGPTTTTTGPSTTTTGPSTTTTSPTTSAKTTTNTPPQTTTITTTSAEGSSTPAPSVLPTTTTIQSTPSSPPKSTTGSPVTATTSNPTTSTSAPATGTTSHTPGSTSETPTSTPSGCFGITFDVKVLVLSVSSVLMVYFMSGW